MKSFELQIITSRYVEPWTAEVYEPFEGCAFVAQRPTAGSGDWSVTHRRTTFIGGSAGTRKTALQIASDLHAACPSAMRVRAIADDQGRLVKLTGPHRKLRAEIEAFLGARSS